MPKRFMGISSGILAIVLALWPSTDVVKPPGPTPANDVVHAAFVTYEQIWRKHAVDTAAKLESGELKDEKAAWDHLAVGQAPARKIAFDQLAKAEQEYFTSKGGWTAVDHAKLLRSYAHE